MDQDGVSTAYAIRYEPRLVEEVVVAVVRDRAEELAFRAERDELYTIADPDEREARFCAVHAAWFERLGLAQPVAEAFREQSSVAAGTTGCLVTRASSRREEGAELFVAAGAGETDASRRTAVLRLCPGAFADREALRALLRHELTHVADMLDPAFRYTPRWVGAATETLPDALLRERYRVLWGTSVDGRLARRGWAPSGVGATRLVEFATAFPMLGRRTEAAFARRRARDGDVRQRHRRRPVDREVGAPDRTCAARSLDRR